MRALLRNVLLPMLKHCPPSLLPALLWPVLPQLLTQLLRRLECGYTAVGEGGTVERHTVHATIHSALEAFLGANTLAVVRCLFEYVCVCFLLLLEAVRFVVCVCFLLLSPACV